MIWEREDNMEDFNKWLMEEKGMALKSAHDVCSRIKRVQSILGTENISDESLSELERNTKFQEMTMSVKSQLKRSIVLYREFIKA